MDEAQPAVSSLDRAHIGISMRILIGLAEVREEEGRCEQTERRQPATENMGEQLQCCTKSEHDPEVEYLCQVRIRQCSKEPAEEGDPVTKNYWRHSDVMFERSPYIMETKLVLMP